MKMEKYQSSTSNKTLLCIVLILFLFHSDLYSQAYKFSFNNIPLSDALVKISGQLNIKVAFDAKKLGSVIINKEVTANSADEVVADLLTNSGFEYRIKYNRYLIVKVDSNGKDAIPTEYQLVGSISDKESGEYLPYATVISYNENLLIPASANGSFCIKNIITNPLHLLISYIGYNPLDTTILLSEPESNFNLKLDKRMLLMENIVVKGARTGMVDLRNDVDFATTINPSKLNDLPVPSETDIFRMLQLLPGISYNENGQGLSIRGGSNDQNLVLFDGQTLYNLSHYYGLVSALNPNVIKDLQIYKGGYYSRFGERVSGIVDITGKSGNQVKPRLYGDLNLLSGNLTAELPVGKKVSVIGAIRRSYSDIYATEFSKRLFDRNLNLFREDSVTIINQTRPKYYFYDYNAKVTFSRSNVENISISFNGGKDYFSNSYTGRLRRIIINTTDLNNWNNSGLNAIWNRQWNESFFTTIQAGYSEYVNQVSNETVIDRTFAKDFHPDFLPDLINTFNTFIQNRLKDSYVSFRNSYKITNNNQLDFGFIIRNNTIYYHKDADKLYIYDNMNQSGTTTSSYIQDRLIVSDKFILKPGLRLSYYYNTGKLYAEPRFSANYKFSDEFSIRIATGRYHQFIKQVLAQQETGYNRNFWIMADKSNFTVVSSNHFIAGFTLEKGRFLFDAEMYYKSFEGLQEYIFVSQFLRNSDFKNYFQRNGNEVFYTPKAKPSFYVDGQGRSFGLDLLLRYQTEKFTSWLSFSKGRSLQNYKAINTGADIPAPNDQLFQLSWTNMFSKGKWNFGTITLYSSGTPYIDFSTSSTNLPIVRNYKRLPDYFRTDFSVNYNITLPKANLKTGISFINIFNTQNYFDVSTRKFDFENTTFSETTLVQSQSISLNLFMHFDF